MTENKILETWLKWLRNGEWYNVADDIERLLLEPDRDVCWCGVPLTKPDKPCKCIDQRWCANFDRCKRND